VKLVKLMSVALVATSLGSVATVATPTMNVQAQSQKSLKTIPKKFRGTWYHYEKADGYDYQKISATKIKSRFERKNSTRTMHQFNLKKGISNKNIANYNNPHKWMYAYKHGTKYVMDSWETYPGLYASDRSTYSMTTRKYKGKTVKVIKKTLTNFNGRWYIYSPSKALAKHLWNLDNK